MSTKGIIALAVGSGLLAIGAAPARADVVSDGGFEINTTTGLRLPTEYALWSGDVVEIVTARDGIAPFEGAQMVHFMYSTPRGPAGGVIGSELWQIIDISAYRGLIDSGRALANAEGWFNRIDSEDPNIDTQFSIVLSAYAGAPADFPGMWKRTELALVEGFAYTDGDTRTWEMATTSMMIPVGADFLVYRITSTENVFDDAFGVEFHGHYGDAFSLEITEVPAPASLALLLGGALTMSARRRRGVTG